MSWAGGQAGGGGPTDGYCWIGSRQRSNVAVGSERALPLCCPPSPSPPTHAHLRRAKQRQQRLAALERRYDEAAAAGGSGPAEPHLGDNTSEESEGEAAHFATRQGEVQEAADAGGPGDGLGGARQVRVPPASFRQERSTFCRKAPL